MKNNSDILVEFKARFKESENHGRYWRKEARDLYAFKAGDQWSSDDKSVMDTSKRPMTVFNISDKYVDALVGLEINNRQEPRFVGREMGDARVNELYTSAVKWCRDLAEAEDEETDAFADLLWVGMAWIEHSVDDMDDETIVKQDRVDPLEMLWDPRARKKNLVDRRYQIRVKRVTPDEYQEKFGTKYDAASPSSEGSLAIETMMESDEPHIGTLSGDYPQETSSGGLQQPRGISIADYQWRETVTKYRVSTSTMGENTFTDDEWAKIEPQMQSAKMADPNLTYRAEKIRGYRYFRAFICGEEISKPVELKVGFTYEAMTGKRDRNRNLWYGIGRGMQDPQKWFNKFFSSIIFQLSVGSKGGLLAEDDAFDDLEEAKRTWANPSEITVVRPGTLAAKKVDSKPGMNYPAGMDRLMEFTVNMMPQVVGINAELLGLQDKVQAGIVEAQRKQGAIAMVAWAFDSLRRYHKRSGKLMAELVREFMADGRLIRVIGKDKAQYVPLMRDKLATKYDVVVDEAPTSVNMKERTWAMLEGLLPMALKVGLPMPPSLLDYTPLPEDLVQEWKAMLQPKPEDTEEQKQQKQIAMREIAGRIAKDESAARLNDARAQDISAKTPVEVQKTHAETLAEFANAGAAQAAVN